MERQMYTLLYYKRIESRWLKGQIRNLTLRQCNDYRKIMKALLGNTTLMTLEKN